MNKLVCILLVVWSMCCYVPLHAQVTNRSFINNITLQVDTSVYSSAKDTVNFQGREYMYFNYTRENEVCDVKVYLNPGRRVKHMALIESEDFKLIDSLVNFNNLYYTFKVQFQHLSESAFLRFRLNILSDSTSVIEDIPLLPTAKTTLRLNVKNDELTVGEEKSFELISNLPENIKPVPDWQITQDIDYKVVLSNGQLKIHFLPNAVGTKTITLNLETLKPYWINKKLSCQLPPITQTFTLKSAGLLFLQADKSDITLDDNAKNEGFELQLEGGNVLQLNSVYLVEAKEESGSPLIAEIFTRERVSNNRMLCTLRVFNYHKKSEGYLYIKSNNVTRFITNFNIIPRINIEHIKVMRNGKDWTDDASIYPGETVNLRLEGQSLDKAKFRFGELINLTNDTAVRTEKAVEFRLKVPVTISKKTVDIVNDNQSTGKYLTVKEFQKSHPLDFVYVNYSGKPKCLTDIHGPELYDKTIKDLVISFMPNKIDSATTLYGKQYLHIEAKILGKKGEIIDMATVDDFAVCPGDKSPRASFYDKSDCKNAEISLNTIISNTTYSLNDWSRIKLTFKNPSDKYTQDARNKTIEIVLQKHVNFDIDVSFPTGLLVKKVNTSGYGNFGGVSMAVIGQYSFYKEDRINQLKPYKIGAGFLALNAFDFSQTSSRDVGAVILGTLNPVNTDRKLTFSIYLGGGYLLSAKTLFWLIGPGFSVQF